MNEKKTIHTGVIGTIVMGLCCFTPLLVVILGALGLSAWLAWLDFVLLPGLVIFIGVAAYGLYRRKQQSTAGK